MMPDKTTIADVMAFLNVMDKVKTKDGPLTIGFYLK